MRFVQLAAMMTAVLLAGCGADHTTDAPDRKITLSKGDSLRVITGADGSVEIIAKVLEGKDGGGTYRTTNVNLHEIGMAAKNALLESDTTVSVTVNAENEIVAIAHAKTLR